MSKSLKSIIFAILGLIGLLSLIFVALVFFVDASVYKFRLERAASDALGMEVHVDGRLAITVFPNVHLRFADVRIRNRGADVAAAKEAGLEIALFPLLHKEVRIMRITLKQPRITIKRSRDGTFNFEKQEEGKKTFLTLAFDNLSLSDGAFLYHDEQSGERFEVQNFKLDTSSARLAGANSAELLKNLAFTAEFACRELKMKGLKFSDVKFTCKGKDGIFALNPVTLRLCGGQGAGSVEMDFSAPIFRYSVRSSLTKFRIEEYLKTYSSKKVAEGPMDFSSHLSMRGNTAREIRQTLGGEVSLHGTNLTLYGSDLDQEFSRYESSQNFNLLDVGAVFLAGPLGLAVTKGYNFASIFRGSGDRSSIGKLCSDWKVERGVAQARDVAMATKENRVALKGRLNFVNERFENVTVALIDARGCTRVQQKVHGPFGKPVVEKPNVLMSLAGPALNLLKQARDLFRGGTCEAFYAGSVAAPK